MTKPSFSCTRELYTFWLSLTSDRRYLRSKRWKEIEKAIITYNTKKVLEFGCGVSTLLFDFFNQQVQSYETDQDFINFVLPYCSSNVSIKFWDNKSLDLTDSFDLALVDGALPRIPQLSIATKSAPLIAVDDFQGRAERRLSPLLNDFERIDSKETYMSVWRANNYAL